MFGMKFNPFRSDAANMRMALGLFPEILSGQSKHYIPAGPRKNTQPVFAGSTDCTRSIKSYPWVASRIHKTEPDPRSISSLKVAHRAHRSWVRKMLAEGKI